MISTHPEIGQGGLASPRSDGRLDGFQAGTDLFANAGWRAGVYVGRLEGDMRVSGFARGGQNLPVGSNDLRSEYVAAYGTWTGDTGLYADAVIQAGRHRYMAKRHRELHRLRRGPHRTPAAGRASGKAQERAQRAGYARRHMPHPDNTASSPISAMLATAALALLLAAPTTASAAAGCLDTATQVPPPARALAMATFAQQEHLAFGGQTMDAEGRLTYAGAWEAEDFRATAQDLAPWQRVLGYWQATGVRLRGTEPDAAPGSSEPQSIDAALARVAVIDAPWSAAFISWIAQRAGLTAEEFVFSEAHADYAGAAWRAGADEAAGRANRYAMRACDLTRTPPRVGDLVCQARGVGAGYDTFDKIGEALAQRPTGGDALPMHCDVVVGVDAAGFDAIGGNVIQSVTLRRLAFTPGTRRLDASYLPEGCTAGAPGCIDRHMSRQPWSLLLQWR